MVFRFAFRRFYFRGVGLLLLTLPLFAMARISYAREYPLCVAPTGAVSLHLRCNVFTDGPAPVQLYRNGALYAVWQRGFPPYDYWPLGLALLAGGIALQAFVMVRSRTHNDNGTAEV